MISMVMIKYFIQCLLSAWFLTYSLLILKSTITPIIQGRNLEH